MDSVTIKLDKERTLRLTLKGMLEFEELTGKNLFKGFKLTDLGLKDSAALIWACLAHEDKDLTYDKVLCMVDINNIGEVMDALTKCLTQCLPESKDKPPLPEKPQAG